jgi:hypothetical protein
MLPRRMLSSKRKVSRPRCSWRETNRSRRWHRSRVRMASRRSWRRRQLSTGMGGLGAGDDKGMWDAQVLGGGSRAVCLHRRGLPRSDGRELWRHRLLAIDQVLRLGLRLSLTQRRRKRCLVEVSCEGQRLHDPAVVPQFLRGDSHWLQRVRHGMGNRARPCRASGPHFVPAPHPGLCGEALGLHHPLTGAPADTEPRSQQFVGMNGREAEGWHAASPPAGCKARFNGPVRPGGRGSASPPGKVVARR